MSVVRGAATARWAAVAAGVGVLCALPSVVAALPVDPQGAPRDDVRATLARTVAAATTPHEGLAEMRGSLGLPDLPRLESATQLLGDRTRARVWWDSPERWRVAVLRPAGERDAYRVEDTHIAYDYERASARTTIGDPAVRLPRADDLTPPQVVARLLRAVGPEDRISVLPARRVAGHAAFGLRVEPADLRSTVAAVDLWAHDVSALPVRVEVRGRTSSRPAFVAEYLQVRLGRPDPEAMAVRVPTEASYEGPGDADVIAAYDRLARWRLPDSLGGLARSPDVVRVNGTGAYGTGLVRVFVVPLPHWRLQTALGEAEQAPGATAVTFDGGAGLILRTSLLGAALVADDDGDRAYMIAGTVDDGVLRRVASDLLASPPEPR